MTPKDSRSIPEIVALLAQCRGPALQRLVAELADDDRNGVRQAVDIAVSRDRAHRREQSRLKRLYALEGELRAQGFVVVAGVDEVGRGALAGPLSAGACVLPPSPRIPYLNDSKQLTPAKREELAEWIKETAICWAVAHVPAQDVDAMGITAALKRAMREALASLEKCADHVVLDGRPLGLSAIETAVVGGDGKVAAIAAASIVAKVSRDALMREMAVIYPEYGFEINKGYGTPEHLEVIAASGISPEHRKSFMPCSGTERLF